LKGGVGKSVSSINVAHILATIHNFRVLLIDNDKQGNTSDFFGQHGYDHPSIADVLTEKGYNIRDAICQTKYPGLSLLPANMSLLKADKLILVDTVRPQQTRLRSALKQVEDQYDFVIIDNAPDLSMSVINALVATNDVLIPIKIDKFSFDGVDEILSCIEDIREFNEGIRIAGGFVTMFEWNTVNRQGGDILEEREDLPMLKTRIRKAVAVNETTFAGTPIVEYAKNSNPSTDYLALVEEYLAMK
jgi:chromosome partitioning protein